MTSRSGEADHGVTIENQWYDEWVASNMQDMTGKVAIITGSNSGTGFWAANALAGKGCTVILACRNATKAQHAKEEILGRFPQAKVDILVPLDNMDLASVKAFAQAFDAKYDRLDLLLNNAGIMGQPLVESKDCYDIQFQTNHLSHFLLTSLLWDKLVNTQGQSRVVQHSSGAHWLGGPIFDPEKMDYPSYSWGWFGINVFLWRALPFMGLKPADNWKRYGVSKLCNVLFMRSLQRKIDAKAGLEEKIISTACHPGYANTNLQNVASDSMSNWEKSNQSSAQSAADGSLPLLMAAVGKDVNNGDYLGPSGRNEMKGPPVKQKTGGNSNDPAMADLLWSYSEECIGSKFEV